MELLKLVTELSLLEYSQGISTFKKNDPARDKIVNKHSNRYNPYAL